MDRRYWTDAARAFVRHLRTPGFAKGIAVSGLRADLEPEAPVVQFLDAYPELEVELGAVTYRRSNLDPMEQYVLGALARLKQPKRVFEIGTYDGATTLLLARNCDAEILTLDLPPERAAVIASVVEEERNVTEGVGGRFRGEPEAERITQLLGDSRMLDFSPWYGTVDLVLIDAGHDYESAKADTETALKLLSPNGVAVWDDYQIGWPGVVRAVEETGVAVVRIAGTDFAVYDRGSAATR